MLRFYRLLVTRSDAVHTHTEMLEFSYGEGGYYRSKNRAYLAALSAAAGQFDSARFIVLSKVLYHYTETGARVKFVANRTVENSE